MFKFLKAVFTKNFYGYRFFVFIGAVCLCFLNLSYANQVAIRLSCLNKSVIHSTLSQRDLNITKSVCLDELRMKFHNVKANSIWLSEDVLEVILAMVVTHNAAPYGPSSAVEYDDIIKSKFLHCGNQTRLMGFLLPHRDIHIIGFNGGAVGNHAQVLYQNKNATILLDPTTSLTAITTFNDLLQGKPINTVMLINQNLENDNYIRNVYTPKISTALLKGQYLPMDILYYYQSLDHSMGKGPLDPYITPAGVGWRKKL